MIDKAIKSAIGGLSEPVVGWVKVKERTKQIVAIGRAYAAVAAASWRPWLAKAVGYILIIYSVGSFFLTASILVGIWMAGSWINGMTIQDLLTYWQGFGAEVFGFAIIFIGGYTVSRGAEKYAQFRPDGKVAKVVTTVKNAVTGQPEREPMQQTNSGIERRESFVNNLETPTPRAPLIDLEKIRAELRRDEGYRLEIYRDTEGHKTAGIGHKLVPNDAEYNLPLGAKITKERAFKWFESDLAGAIEDVQRLFPKLAALPFDLRHVLVNLMFNLGYSRLKNFTKTRTFIAAGEWDMAAAELLDSEYSKQVGIRADRLSARIAALSDVQIDVGIA